MCYINTHPNLQNILVLSGMRKLAFGSAQLKDLSCASPLLRMAPFGGWPGVLRSREGGRENDVREHDVSRSTFAYLKCPRRQGGEPCLGGVLSGKMGKRGFRRGT